LSGTTSQQSFNHTSFGDMKVGVMDGTGYAVYLIKPLQQTELIKLMNPRLAALFTTLTN
jgi:hypothetical protein